MNAFDIRKHRDKVKEMYDRVENLEEQNVISLSATSFFLAEIAIQLAELNDKLGKVTARGGTHIHVSSVGCDE